ncbi:MULTISPECIES: hypothetical protein [unclassified Ensifer]|uniref:hypothetical protein n=1 Tax=unclassified Ensifer TaxID=2633371 RepID=UPI0012E37A2E|nr:MULTISPECIES: hypothetical protein [unclassified Ensifer]
MDIKVARFHRWIIERLGGSYLFERLKNKATGGAAFRDGRDYEIAYTLHVIVLELALQLSQFRSGIKIEDLEKFYFDQNPDAYVDDLQIRGVLGEILIQLKKGQIDWNEIVFDFKVQRRLDVVHKNATTYRLVNGSERTLEWLRDRLDKEGLPNSQASIFRYSKTYTQYVYEHPDFYEAMEQLTGSSGYGEQETAYRALMYELWKAEGKVSFVAFLAGAAKRPFDYLSRLNHCDRYAALEDSLREKFKGCVIKISGRILHFEAFGFLQTFLLPSDENKVFALADWAANLSSGEPGQLERAVADIGSVRVERPE